jgi:hypothetical protein
MSRVGVALTKCFYCGQGDRIVMNRVLTERLASKVEEMHGKVIDMEPCRQCAQWMKQGVILISVDESKTKDEKNPWRDGRFAVVRDEAIKRIVQPEELASTLLFRRWGYISSDTADKIGLFPTPEVTNE